MFQLIFVFLLLLRVTALNGFNKSFKLVRLQYTKLKIADLSPDVQIANLRPTDPVDKLLKNSEFAFVQRSDSVESVMEKM
jgi:hypothetical protein